MSKLSPSAPTSKIRDRRSLKPARNMDLTLAYTIYMYNIQCSILNITIFEVVFRKSKANLHKHYWSKYPIASTHQNLSWPSHKLSWTCCLEQEQAAPGASTSQPQPSKSASTPASTWTSISTSASKSTATLTLNTKYQHQHHHHH